MLPFFRESTHRWKNGFSPLRNMEDMDDKSCEIGRVSTSLVPKRHIFLLKEILKDDIEVIAEHFSQWEQDYGCKSNIWRIQLLDLVLHCLWQLKKDPSLIQAEIHYVDLLE